MNAYQKTLANIARSIASQVHVGCPFSLPGSGQGDEVAKDASSLEIKKGITSSDLGARAYVRSDS